jgi:DNA-binding NarL/FixJ family response regulator
MNKLISGLRQGVNKTDSPESLTQTEIKVMALLGKGKSNKEIAAELKCSVKTIKNHLNSIYNKLGVTNRTEAVIKAIEKGLISPEG